MYGLLNSVKTLAPPAFLGMAALSFVSSLTKNTFRV